MPSFGQQQPTSTLLSHPNRLSNPFQSGSCQKKSCSASQTGLCASEVDLGLSAWMEEGGGGQMSGCCSVQGHPMSSAGCSKPEQSCPGPSRQTLHSFSMKSPRCVHKIHRLQVPWGFNGPICLHTSQILLYSYSLW